MDRLPPELFDLVLSFVPIVDLVKYVTVSLAWQYAIEPETFKSPRVKSTELEYFDRVYTPSHRRATLGSLIYDIKLPEYPAWKCTKFEREEDQAANNEAFTNAIVGLFKILSDWKDVAPVDVKQAPIKLEMSASSPSDDPKIRGDVPGDLGGHRWVDSLLKLLRLDDVMPVERITKFYWPNDPRYDFPEDTNDRDTDAATIAAVGAKLPRLEVAFWSLQDRDYLRTQPRYQQRHGRLYPTVNALGIPSTFSGLPEVSR